MKEKKQAEKARIFLELHNVPKLLILPIIWDPIGARILQGKGYPAAATASAAISASLGYEDGEKIKLLTLLALVRRIVKSVDIPVSADFESGYSSTLPQLKESIKQIIDTGIVGINIEDGYVDNEGLRPLDDQYERISVVRDTAESAGIHLVINARIDSFLKKPILSKKELISEITKRANAYISAGADCVYPIGIMDLDIIIKLRKTIQAPINVLGSGNSESLLTLQKIGVNRVSFGPNIFRSCMKKFEKIANELYKMGNNNCFSEEILSRDEIGNYLKREKEISSIDC